MRYVTPRRELLLEMGLDMSLQFISSTEHSHAPAGLALANDADAQAVAFDNVQRIDLHFPKFTDGRAFSQAFILRRRGFTGDIRAHGDVLIDQLVQMQRSGFSSVVLRDDQNAEHGKNFCRITHRFTKATRCIRNRISQRKWHERY